jgi:endonuclease/exonuclease/phosphatase family metal-dependent hydrolase
VRARRVLGFEGVTLRRRELMVALVTRAVRRGHPVLLAVLLAVALGMALLTAPARGAATRRVPPARIGVLQFNLCGNGCKLGPAAVNDVTQALAGRRDLPLVLTLNEVCRTQYDLLLQRLHRYVGSFRATIPSRCADGSDYGIAVLVRSGGSVELGSWTLTTIDGDEPRAVVCRGLRVYGATRPLAACATHIDFHPADRADQLQEIARIGADLHRRYTVVIGGDVNATPRAAVLDPLYSDAYPGGRGIFDEADAAGHQRVVAATLPGQNEPTGCGRVPCGGPAGTPPTGKIDDVFVSRGDARDLTASVLGAAHSDHAMVLAWMTLV